MLLALQVLVILLIFFYWTSGKSNKEIDKIPGPPGWFLINNTLDFLMDPVQLFYHIRMLSNQYNGLFKIKFGSLKGVILSSPENIEKVINGSKFSNKGYLYRFLEPWLKDGTLLSNGAKWQQRRKLLTHALRYNILANFKSTFDEGCQNFVDALEKEVHEPKTEVMPYIEDLTIKLICETAMGAKLDEGDRNFGKKYKEGIYELGQCTLYRVQRIWMHPYCIFKLTSVGRKLNNILKTLNSFRDRLINSRRIFYRNSKTNINDMLNDNINEDKHLGGKMKLALLDLLLQAEIDGAIDEKGIAEELDTFMLGGHDTTANTLQFSMMILANNPDIQEKIISEFNDIFGSSDRRATMADLAQMKYLECCIKECLRLYPPAPILNRKVNETLTLGKYQVPAGTEYGILLYDLHRRSDQFVEPLEFRPERFLGVPTWHPYAYLPFSAGPRQCVGQKYAMMELKLALSSVLRRYRLLPVTKPNDIIFILDFVLRVKEPICVKLELRSGPISEA